MRSTVTLFFAIYLLSSNLAAQHLTIERVMNSIETNNKELKALSALISSRQLEARSGNNLSDPNLGAFYLPFGEHLGPDYYEFQIDQTFYFPTVYKSRGALVKMGNESLDLQFEIKRKDVLNKAQKYCLEITYLNKRLEVENRRVKQASHHEESLKKAYSEDSTHMLAYTKARVSRMQQEFNLLQTETDKQNVLLALQNLNGGIELLFNESLYSSRLDTMIMDSIWADKLRHDPELLLLLKEKSLAAQELKLSRNQSLPMLTAGYNYQGVVGNNYHGVYGGLSIPLWSNQHRVKAARMKLKYSEIQGESETSKNYIEFKRHFTKYQLELEKYQSYSSTIEALNTDAMWKEIYESGEMTYVLYYMELQFYREAYDEMLNMELFLHQMKADLMKYTL